MTWVTLSKTLFLAAICFPLFGCGRDKITVLDTSGKPIAGAEVQVETMSTTPRPNLTNDKGMTHIPTSLQKVLSITVSKPGYAPVRLEVPLKPPLQVVLPAQPRKP